MVKTPLPAEIADFGKRALDICVADRKLRRLDVLRLGRRDATDRRVVFNTQKLCCNQNL